MKPTIKLLAFLRRLAVVALTVPLFAAAQVDYVDDATLRGLLQRHLERWNADSNRVTLATLKGQLDRTNAAVKIAGSVSRSRTWPEIYERVKDSVLIVGELYKCGKCSKWHANTASGFVLSEDGALVTNHHVVREGDGAVMGAMNMGGEFFPVTEVLAASRAEDIAVVRLRGRNFAPLPLLADKPVGSPVAVLSHPDLSFYSLTEGIISRYSTERVSRQSKLRRHSVVITADYAKGSSGAPVFDTCGNVVGLASSTESVYYEEDHGRQENLQQVFKYCVPADCVLKLLRKP